MRINGRIIKKLFSRVRAPKEKKPRLFSLTVSFGIPDGWTAEDCAREARWAGTFASLRIAKAAQDPDLKLESAAIDLFGSGSKELTDGVSEALRKAAGKAGRPSLGAAPLASVGVQSGRAEGRLGMSVEILFSAPGGVSGKAFSEMEEPDPVNPDWRWSAWKGASSGTSGGNPGRRFEPRAIPVT